MARQIRKWNPGNAANIFVRVLLSEAGALLGGLTTEQWDETLEFFGHRCAYTGEPLVKGKTDQDHAIPMSREHCGLHLFGNVVPATKAANNAKGGKHYREFTSDQERRERIDAFLRQAGYEEKIAVFGDLQRYCDAQYDAVDAMCRVNRRYLRSFLPTEVSSARDIETAVAKGRRRRSHGTDTLPITLSPSPASAFKQRLLVTKRAWIVIEYVDGRREVRPWRADQISERSNIIGNLRTRPEFRSGEWQRLGIARVQATIDRPEDA